MKHLLRSSSIIFLFIGLISIAPPPKKVKYSSTEGKLSVVFPDNFTVTEESNSGAKTVKAQLELDDMVFFVAYTVHEAVLEEHYELASVSLESFAEALNTEIIERSDWKVKKNLGTRAVIYSSDNKLKGEYRAILVGQIQYQLVAIGMDTAWDEKGAKTFLDSFKLKK